MNITKPRGCLEEIIQTWKDQIICLPPRGSGYNAYLIDSNGNYLNYIHANCDNLRHMATNYDALLIRIRAEYEGYLKEAILNTIKYEATRRAFKKQHEWIQNSYKSLIEQKKINADQQNAEIEKLKEIISQHQAEITQIKSECRGRLAKIQASTLLQQRETEIEQKNTEIARLNQQLLECDRELTTLKSELNNGLNELKLKYKWLITQFIQDRAKQQQIAQKNKSLKTCQNLFQKAQKKLNALNHENTYLRQENLSLQNKIKMLKV
jgi:chromosome segregation ATPase